MQHQQTERQTMIVPIIRRSDLSTKVFRAYWRAVHGPVAARLTGPDFYEQLHLDLGVTTTGRTDPLYGAEALDGLAILSFPSSAALDRYRALGPIMPADEHNAFAFAARYDLPARTDGLAALPRALATDRVARGGLIAFLTKAPHIDNAIFAEAMTQMMLRLRGLAGVMGVWLGLPLPRPTERPAPEPVDRFTPKGRQFQAVLRLATRSPEALRPHLVTALELDTVVAGARIQAIGESRLFLYENRISLAALRGDEAAQLIRELHAANQLDPDLVALFAPAGRQLDFALE